jgi:transcriptional regulator with XRE-family HTH domain
MSPEGEREQLGNTEYAKQVGRRIKAARQSLDLQQAEVAALVGVPTDTFGSWERGYRLVTTDTLPALCAALHRPVTFFLGLPDPQELSENERTLVEVFRCIRSSVLQTQAIDAVRSLCRLDTQLASGGKLP